MGTVSFPNMGLEFNVNRSISVFGFDIAWYAIIIAIGFILACIYGLTRMRKTFGLDPDRSIDAILAGMVGGIIGARLYYVAFSWDEFKDDLVSIFMTRNGGLAIYGGIIGAVAFGLIMCKIRNIKMLPMLDVTALGFLLAQGIGRWGNFINQEAYGSAVSEDYLLGMGGSAIDGLVHPCFLYESIWCLLGFLLLHLYSKHRKFDGELSLMYLIWYGAGRVVIEGLRADSLYMGNLRVSQVLSGLILLAGIVILVMVRSRIKRENDPDYLKLYVNTKESAEALALADERLNDPQAYRQKMAKLKEEKRLAKAGSKPEDDETAVNDAQASDALPEEKAEETSESKSNDAKGDGEAESPEKEEDDGDGAADKEDTVTSEKEDSRQLDKVNQESEEKG